MRAFARSVVRHPHLLKIVEFSDFRPENMHHNVTDIDQDPIVGRLAFDSDRRIFNLFQSLLDLIRDRADMAVLSPGGNHHEIRDG